MLILKVLTDEINYCNLRGPLLAMICIMNNFKAVHVKNYQYCLFKCNIYCCSTCSMALASVRIGNQIMIIYHLISHIANYNVER